MESAKICQSCGMDLPEESFYGKNSDGSKNDNYCKYCFPNGEFSKDETLEEMAESRIPFRIKNYPDEQTARENITRDLSLLGRWKK
jgi:hypothetical protein